MKSMAMFEMTMIRLDYFCKHIKKTISQMIGYFSRKQGSLLSDNASSHYKVSDGTPNVKMLVLGGSS